jgi:predicted transcriptional regulator
MKAWTIAVLLLAPSVALASGAPTVTVPLPRVGDEGHYERVIDGEPAENVTFAWSAGTFADAWGRPVAGAQLHFDHLLGARCRTTVTSQAGQLQSSVGEGLAVVVSYPEGATPVSIGAPSSCAAGIEAGPSRTIVGSSGAFRTIYGADHPWFPAWSYGLCAFRSDAQGSTLHAGDRLAMACAPPGDAWVVGAPETRDGRLTVTVSNASVSLRFAAGIAYPLTVDARQDGHDDVWTLTGLRVDGAPLPQPALAPAPGAEGLAPIDRLLGPDDADAHLPLRLSDAARAAVGDPTLLDLRALLSRGDAALVSAVMTGPGQPSRALVQWALLYAAPDAPSVAVTCVGASGVARCRSGADASAMAQLGMPPTDLRGLPTSGATFGDARERWEDVDDGAASAGVGAASYHAWGSPDGRATLELGASSDRLASLVLASGAADHALIPLAAPWVVSDLPAGLPGEVVGQGAPPTASPPVLPGIVVEAAAAAAAVGALAVLLLLGKGAFAALFARLRGVRVLGSELRQRILEVVRAEPGIHASGVMEAIGREHGVSEHHLGVLVREGFLTVVETPGFRRYFLTGRFSHNEMRALAALRDGQNEKVFRIIQAAPGIHLSELAERSGLSLAYASRTVKKLHEAGLVDRVQVGRTVSLHAIER